MSNPPRFLLTLESTPHATSVYVRLRAALKVLLRAFGFRCIKCVEVKEPAVKEVRNADDQ